MADGFYRLTYRDIAERLGISPDAARMKANRKAKAGHWRLLPDEAPGGERLVEIPSAELDGIVAKAVVAERSAPAEQAEQTAAIQPATPAEQAGQAAPIQPAAPAEQHQAAERSGPVEPYVPPKVSVSFDPQHPHLPPAGIEQAQSAEAIATPEQAVPETPIETAEQSSPNASIAEPEPSLAEQPEPSEQPAEAEQSAPAEPVETAEQVDVQPELRSGDDDFEFDESAGAEGGDKLVSTLTARVATLTNRLLAETNALENERAELAASLVRESELKVEIERLCARISELSGDLERGHRPWWRRLVQGSAED